MTEILPTGTGFTAQTFSTSQYSLRVRFYLQGKTVSLTRIGVYTINTITDVKKVFLYNSSGTMIASGSGTYQSTSSYPPAWVPLSSPVTLVANDVYYVGWVSSSSLYFDVGTNPVNYTAVNGIQFTSPSDNFRSSFQSGDNNGNFSGAGSLVDYFFPVALDVVESNTKYFNGTSFINSSKKYFNGTSWVDTGQTKVKGTHF